MVGENELNTGKVILRDMSTGAQEEIALDSLVENLQEVLKSHE
jgi:histidyl-tRNA synthetase